MNRERAQCPYCRIWFYELGPNSKHEGVTRCNHDRRCTKVFWIGGMGGHTFGEAGKGRLYMDPTDIKDLQV